MRTLSLVFSTLALVACGSDSPAPVVDDSPPCPGTVNLLKNPALESSEDRLLIDWNSTQHGAIPSFIVSVNEGTVTVERNGPEPWYNLEQFIDLSGYAGHQMLYKAELKLSLDSEDWSHAFEPVGGLQVLIWALAEPAILGTRLVYQSSAEHSPNLGETDWFTAHVLFTVPERVKRTNLGLILQANGSMSMRNPALLDCGPAPESGA